ncbi:hypothetical protein NI080884_3537 [Escherichia coli]|uniref:hypothetical protein n=1 Tax=Escherichia coli TaxID=562 RepID=UPI000D595506|nr:hypothetical protein [Escherichia coli]BDV89857.1 hypothetical protein NI080884_3537 [Escherichia coli]
MSGEKPRYRVLRLSHIHNTLWPEGAEIEYEGEPGSALEPVNDAARQAKAKVAGKVSMAATSTKIINDVSCNQVNHLIPTRVLVKGGEITCKILK